MLRRSVLLILLACTCFINFGTSQNFGSPPIHKAVFIIVDGIPEDVIRSVETPNLDDIAATGTFLPAYVGGEAGSYSRTPTISAVGYNSLLTGTWVNKHNVWDNDILNPNYHYQTIFKLFKSEFPSKRAAVFTSWLDNRTKLIGTGLEATGHFQMDYYFDGFELDTLAFPHDEETTYVRDIDDLVSSEAARYIAEKSPDLSWVYLWFTDNMGHKYGDHPKFYEAIRHMDGQMGKIWRAVQEREKNHNEKWLVVITTDHGRTADTGKGHGGQSERERNTWVITNVSDINAYGQKHRVAVTDILPSVAYHMGMEIPKYPAMELDGVSFLGEVDAADLRAVRSGSQIRLTWDSFKSSATGRIWVTTTNRFGSGGEDRYLYLGEVDLDRKEMEFSVSEIPSNFYKIVLETPNHYLNTWIVE